MAKYKEMYKGTWQGEPVEFARTWGGYRFSDEECEALLAGKEVLVRGVYSNRIRKRYNCRGKLAHRSYKGFDYVGFDVTKFCGFNEKLDFSN